MRKILFVALMSTMLLTGCGGETYQHLTHEDAQQIIKSNPNAIILDVRTKAEYDKKHIPNALLVPIDELRSGDFSKLPDKNAVILIYCWTGRRAEDSAEILVKHGYTKVYEFGGLVDWNGAVESGDVRVCW
jgi:rhodanese-related sulfurtransferase